MKETHIHSILTACMKRLIFSLVKHKAHFESFMNRLQDVRPWKAGGCLAADPEDRGEGLSVDPPPGVKVQQMYSTLGQIIPNQH